jgi:hypothetical protein
MGSRQPYGGHSAVHAQPDRRGEDSPRCRPHLQGGRGRHLRDRQAGVRGEREGEGRENGHSESSGQTPAESGEEARRRVAINQENPSRSQQDRLRIFHVWLAVCPPLCDAPEEHRGDVFYPPGGQRHRCAGGLKNRAPPKGTASQSEWMNHSLRE